MGTTFLGVGVSLGGTNFGSLFHNYDRFSNGSHSLVLKVKITQSLILKENIQAIQRKNRASYLKKEQPKEKVTDSNRSTMEYSFRSNINFSTDKNKKKCYFSKLNSLRPPPPAIPHSNKVAQQSVF